LLILLNGTLLGGTLLAQTLSHRKGGTDNRNQPRTFYTAQHPSCFSTRQLEPSLLPRIFGYI
jgi:hypothetical protein